MNTLTTTPYLGIDPFLAIDRAELARGTSLKSAIRIWAKEVEDSVQSISTPEIVNQVTATLHRLNALCRTIKVKRETGNRKKHIWLSGSQVRHLREVISKHRDYLMICLMLQAGLRREEVVTLEDSNVISEGNMYLLRFTGKGSKVRGVPITQRLYKLLKEWASENCTEENRILFPVSGQTVMNITRKYGKLVDVPKLAPHDLRRTFAETALQNNVKINKISKLLGQASIETTIRYLNLDTKSMPVIGSFSEFTGF